MVADTVVIVGSQHGNEPLGSEVVAMLNERASEYPGVTGIVGNPKALALNKRYTETNLNQAYHGGSDSYEARRAQEILQLTQDHRYLFDIHSTTSRIEPTLIIADFSEETRAIINVLPFTRIVYFDTQLSRHSLIGSRTGSITFEMNTAEAAVRRDEMIEIFLWAAAQLASGERIEPLERKLYYSSQQIPEDATVPDDAQDFAELKGLPYRGFLLSEAAYAGRRQGFQLTAPIPVEL